jgi:hypothetical protein
MFSASFENVHVLKPLMQIVNMEAPPHITLCLTPEQISISFVNEKSEQKSSHFIDLRTCDIQAYEYTFTGAYENLKTFGLSSKEFSTSLTKLGKNESFTLSSSDNELLIKGDKFSGSISIKHVDKTVIEYPAEVFKTLNSTVNYPLSNFLELCKNANAYLTVVGSDGQLAFYNGEEKKLDLYKEVHPSRTYDGPEYKCRISQLTMKSLKKLNNVGIMGSKIGFYFASYEGKDWLQFTIPVSSFGLYTIIALPYSSSISNHSS